MNITGKIYRLANNYVFSRWHNTPSTASFWYLPEPASIRSEEDLQTWQNTSLPAPFYMMDYRRKLEYTLTNQDGIIVLPYDRPVGQQINPEAAFQYALGLHDQYHATQDRHYLDRFFKYADYFVKAQAADGSWHYAFDWYTSTAPWSSALAQARGASVMLRAWLHLKDQTYYSAMINALTRFNQPTASGGYLHCFHQENCPYFEEYPKTPTAVINGFMASLISIWEIKYWAKESWLETLWQTGIASLEKMLPWYSLGWWTLYDLDPDTPVPNVNSPRYHRLESDYLQVLAILSGSERLEKELIKRLSQYKNRANRLRALGIKCVRKILYR